MGKVVSPKAAGKSRPAAHRPPRAAELAALAADAGAREVLARMVNGWADDLGDNVRRGAWRQFLAEVRPLLLLAEALVALEEKAGKAGETP